MKTFIRSASCISPQQTFNKEFFVSAPIVYNNDILKVIEPGYNDVLETKSLRRMSRIVRTGLATAVSCLKEAGLANADAIVTGTAYGCMEDSESFLRKIVEQDEEMLSPTSFIQSTHNTVGAQVALHLKCHGYNNTFVHRSFSFEHALTDAMLMLHENKATNILAGCADEMSDFTFSILRRFGLYRQAPVSNLNLYNSDCKGSIAGEGTAFFLVSKEPSANNYAEIEMVNTFYKPSEVPVISNHINKTLASKNITAKDVDLVITGNNGNDKHDAFYNALQNEMFGNNIVINYKHLCGEYPTATSFAMWLAANIIKENKLPVCYNDVANAVKDFKRVLIYNNYQLKYHSLIVLSAIK